MPDAVDLADQYQRRQVTDFREVKARIDRQVLGEVLRRRIVLVPNLRRA